MAQLPEHHPADLNGRGIAAYYLAAWVCGSLLFAALVVLDAAQTATYEEIVSAKYFFSVYFLALMFAAPLLLVYALALQVLARILRWQRSAPWMVSGAVLTFVLMITILLLARWPGEPLPWLSFLKDLFELGGRNGVRLSKGTELPPLLAILAGAALAYLLFRIDSAFRPRHESDRR